MLIYCKLETLSTAYPNQPFATVRAAIGKHHLLIKPAAMTSWSSKLMHFCGAKEKS